jgi:phenylalanyl-tRNA synthetase alpha chain
MPQGVQYEELKLQAEQIHKAFEQEFERFVRLTSTLTTGDVSLAEAEGGFGELDEFEKRVTGKKSELSALKKMVGRIAAEDRAAFGQLIQSIESSIRTKLSDARQALEAFIETARTERDRIDVTLPGMRPKEGHLHPLTLVRQKIENIFVSLGYIIEGDREIETDFYNFDALNIPAAHPARDPQDTFYTTESLALRSQTSTVQIHAMERRGVPIRMIAPGRVFRRDTPDATHNPMFFQVEGLCVDRGITMAHLKGTVGEFLRQMYGPGTKTRFRPSYFPFTEPSAEFDFTCFKCDGVGCALCKGTGWIELGGCGMVHPNVLRTVKIDPEEFTGFAFGFGIDRMCAMMFGLDDIRLLFENDIRFLEQFR